MEKKSNVSSVIVFFITVIFALVIITALSFDNLEYKIRKVASDWCITTNRLDSLIEQGKKNRE
jgi:hypothetical protein